MKLIIAILLWFLLFSISWPLALFVLILFPFLLLILIPFKLVAVAIEAVLKLVGAILLFPFRLVKAL